MAARADLSRKERKRLAKKRRKEAKRLAKLRRKQSKRRDKRRDKRGEDRSFVDTGYSFGGRKVERGEDRSFVDTDYSFGGRREGDGGIYRGTHFGLKGDDLQKGYVGLGKGYVGLGKGNVGLGKGNVGLGKGNVGLGKGYVDIGRGSAIQLGNSMTDESSSASTAGARDGFTIFGKPASKQNNSRFGGMRYF